MTKSIIEQELERFFVHVDGINSNNADLRIRIYSAIQKALEELKKKRQCQNGYPHACKKYPGDCDFYVHWLDVEEVFEVKDD